MLETFPHDKQHAPKTNVTHKKVDKRLTRRYTNTCKATQNERRGTMEQEYDAEGEAYGEFVMNWVMGGGLASDAPQAWRQEVLGEEPVPYYMNMTPEERERDNIRFEMEQEGW
jgi:hypothetical protein